MKTRMNPKNGQEHSILGFGCMRFPTKGNMTNIDEEATRKMLVKAIENGVNYIDTAYFYHGGKSESVLGKILKEEGLRDKVTITTKLPPFLVKKPEDIDKIFNKQKERLQTGHIDYYLMHMLSDVQTWERLKSYGIEEWLKKKKASGEIGQVGFSYHGGRSEFLKLLNAYDWDICQIQYNYLDENTQASKEGLKAAAAKGLPVVIMEPLRGGKLVTGLPTEVKKMWDATGRSAADWALRWIWNHPEVTVVLSGMSTMDQVEENIRIASDAQPNVFNDTDIAKFDEARRILNEKVKVPCTGCGYCVPCPAGVDIPTCFSSYNEVYTMNGKKWAYLQATGLMSKKPGNASLCVKCGKCEAHCPQEIKIREKLDEVVANMEKFPYNIAIKLVQKFM